MTRMIGKVPTLKTAALSAAVVLSILVALAPHDLAAGSWVGVGKSMKEETRSVAFGAVTDGGDGLTHYYAFSGHKHYGVFRAYSTANGAAWGTWQPTSLDEYVLYVAGANNTGAAAQVNVVVTRPNYLSSPLVLAGTSNGKVYRSTNHGVSWNAASGLPGTPVMDIAFAGGGILAATAGNGVYRSVDGGATFSQFTTIPWGTNVVMKVEAEPGSPTNFFVVTAKTGQSPSEVSGGVYYWTGSVWQNRSPGGATIYSFSSIEAVDPPENPPPQIVNVRLWIGDMNGSGVLLSNNMGVSWDPSCLSCEGVTCLAVAPDYTAANEHLLIGTGWGWYEHFLVGTTGQCSRRFPKGLSINSITPDPVWTMASPVLWMATSDGIRYLAPGDYPAPPSGDAELSSFDISFLQSSPHAQEDGILYAASRQFGVFRSLDRGTSFTQYMPSLDNASSGTTGAGSGTPVTALALSPSFIGGGTCNGDMATVYMATDGRGVFRSTAAGSQWEMLNTGLPQAGSLRVSQLVHTPMPAPNPLFAGFADQARVARFDGSTWVAGTTVPPGTVTTALALPPNHNGVTQQEVFAGTDQGLYRSLDLGDHWQTETVPGSGPIVAIAFDPAYNGSGNQNLFVARAGSGIYRKHFDVSWKWDPVAGVGDANVTALAISPDFATDHAVAAATGNPMSKNVGGVYISSNSGINFTLQVTGLQDRQIRSLALVRGSAGGLRLVAGVQRQRAFFAEDPFSLTQSPAWQPSSGFESTMGEIRAVATSPAATNIGCPNSTPIQEGGGDLFLGGTRGTFWSNDGGETFRPMNQWWWDGWVCPPTVNALYAFVNPRGTGFAGIAMPMLLAGTDGQGVWYRYAVQDSATGAWDWTQGMWVRSDLTSVSVRHFTRERTLSPIVIRAATDSGTWVSDQTVPVYGANWVDTGLSGDISDIRNAQVTGGLKVPMEPDAPSGGAMWGTVSNSGVWKGLDGGKLADYAPKAVTWYERNGSGPGTLPSLYTQSVIQLSDLTLLCGTQASGVFRSTDEGVAWWEESATALGGFGKPVTDFLESTNGDVLCAVDSRLSGGGVFLSGDQGRHWASISQGFDATEQSLSTMVATSDSPPAYYAGTYTRGSYATTLTALPYPTVASLGATSGSSMGGTSVVVTGTGFLSACPTGYTCPDTSAVVVFGGQDAVTTFNSATQLTATTPGHPGGAVEVWVRNPDTRAVKYTGTFTFNEVEGSFKVTVSQNVLKQVKVTWVNAPGAGATKVFRSPTADFSQRVTAATVSGTSGNYTFLDTTGTDDYTYYYKVE